MSMKDGIASPYLVVLTLIVAAIVHSTPFLSQGSLRARVEQLEGGHRLLLERLANFEEGRTGERSHAGERVSSEAAFPVEAAEPEEAADQCHYQSEEAAEPKEVDHVYVYGGSEEDKEETLNTGIAIARHIPDQTEVIRVVLTGGPCAGKSSALDHLVENATAAGYDVYRMPEIATILLSSGCSMPNPSSAQFEEQLFVFQQQIICFQLQAERSFLKIAGKTGRPSIVIYDRGLLDSKAYMPDDEAWKTLLHSVEASSSDLSQRRQNLTEEYFLGRYDLVVHLVTAADGAPEHYKSGETTDDSGNAVKRGESLEQAVALDGKLQHAYGQHKRHVIIGNGAKGFKEKIERATRAVIEVAGEMLPQPFRKLEEDNSTLRAQPKNLKTNIA